LPKSKNKFQKKIENGKYFENISMHDKQNIIKDYKVDEFTAELALYVTEGDTEAFKNFIG